MGDASAKAQRLEPVGDSHGCMRELLEADARKRVARLTRRQQEVLVLLAQGLSRRAIAGQLGITTHTVGTTLLDITHATEVRGKVLLARLAFQAHATSIWISVVDRARLDARTRHH